MTSKFIQKGYKTLEAMVSMYCREQHGTKKSALCPWCEKILIYSKTRLEKCPHQKQKPTCAKCPIHCYKPAIREQIRNVMRYAGPRMLKHHPFLAIRHLLHGRKKAPPKLLKS